jgi:aspartyl-tRNA synthetase
MLKYGTDKPDLRNPLRITDVTEVSRHVSIFKPFEAAVPCAPFRRRTAAGRPRSFFEASSNTRSKSIGMKGLGYITLEAAAPRAR